MSIVERKVEMGPLLWIWLDEGAKQCKISLHGPLGSFTFMPRTPSQIVMFCPAGCICASCKIYARRGAPHSFASCLFSRDEWFWDFSQIGFKISRYFTVQLKQIWFDRLVENRLDHWLEEDAPDLDIPLPPPLIRIIAGYAYLPPLKGAHEDHYVSTDKLVDVRKGPSYIPPNRLQILLENPLKNDVSA